MRLTARQLDILRAVSAGTRRRGPTVRDLGREVGMRSTQSVFRHLQMLRRFGLINREDGTLTAEGERALTAAEGQALGAWDTQIAGDGGEVVR